MNIILIGMMGSGKSVVGKIISESLNYKFVDTDILIEEKYGKISEIFKNSGEEYFRNLETQTAKEVANFNNTVISTGGGIILKEENMINLKKNACIIFLKAESFTLFTRTLNSDRPLLQDGGIDKIITILEKRTPLYKKYADLIISTDNKTITEIAEEIISNFN
jgi:shikimate kinase